ncbi:TonB-dependent receptor [Sandarakinorhabdus limnophila]|uniref:TonB-dependent receptor n=1 Tax=Sandarakinorhabdus limnophila TaxID=210512 RepID=UPI0026ED44A4|nr:TonB-dependent receptor [Sandarakinorhabdus limnophila]
MQTKTDFRRSVLACSVALGAFGIASAAHAAEAAAEAVDAATDPNMIVVTASKRSQALIDVSQSISVITGADLAYRNQMRIEDFAASVPGFNFQTAGPRAIRLILRGLNTGGSGATVGVVIDETPFSYQSGLANGSIDTANLDTFDMERIEVLKGPQGTLYGATAEGGLLKYVTNKPNVDKVEAAVEANGEIVDQGTTGGTIRGMINIPFWGGKGAIRASGFYQDVAGYVDNPLLGSNNSNRGYKYGGRISLLLKPSDNFSIRLTGSRQDQKFDDNSFVEVVGANTAPLNPPANQFDIANGGRLVQNSFNGNPNKNYYEYANLVLDWDIGFASLLSSTSYGRLSSEFRTDITSANAAPGFTFQQAFAGVYGNDFSLWGRQTNAVKRWNQEFRLTSKPDTNIGGMGLDWQLGGFFAKEDVTFEQFFDAINNTTKAVIETPFPVGGSVLPGKYEEYSGFANATLHFTDKFDVSGGIRYADIKQESLVINYPGLITGVPVITANPITRSSENKVTWSAAVNFKPTATTQLYARVATGYRSGGPNLIIPGAPADFKFTYGPDSVTNYEAGVRTTLFDNMLSIDVAAFYIDWNNVQIITSYVSQPSGTRYNVIGNGGKARSQGVEWSLAFTPVKGIRISDTGAYTDAKLTEDAADLGGFDGDQLPFVPKWSNTLNVDFEAPLGDNAKAFGGASWVYTGERFTGFTSAPGFRGHIALPDYSSFNLQGGVEFGRYSASLYVRNLTNERGLNDYSTGNGYRLTGLAQIIQPRTVGIKLTARY